jgi:hypothetical protein
MRNVEPRDGRKGMEAKDNHEREKDQSEWQNKRGGSEV